VIKIYWRNRAVAVGGNFSFNLFAGRKLYLVKISEKSYVDFNVIYTASRYVAVICSYY
jgi:hypothetical protein